MMKHPKFELYETDGSICWTGVAGDYIFKPVVVESVFYVV
jgi:hypothetical protein